MLERLLYLAIANGVRRTLAEPRFLRRHLRESFGVYGVTEAEVDKLVLAFEKHFGGKKRPVIHQYARGNADFPVFCIVLGQESETQHLLGGMVGEVEGQGEAAGGASGRRDPDAGAPVFGAYESHTFHVFSYAADNPDLALLMYYASKLFIRRAMHAFVAAGLHDIRLSGGDVAPDLEFVPENLFVRRLTFECSSQEAAIGDLSAEEQRAFGVQLVNAEANDVAPLLDGSPGGVWAMFSDDE